MPIAWIELEFPPMPATAPPPYEIYVEDDRYAVPTLHLVAVEDAEAARDVMDRLLSESAHHRGAEVCLEGRALFRSGSYAVAPRVRPSSRAGEALSG